MLTESPVISVHSTFHVPIHQWTREKTTKHLKVSPIVNVTSIAKSFKTVCKRWSSVTVCLRLCKLRLWILFIDLVFTFPEVTKASATLLFLPP